MVKNKLFRNKALAFFESIYGALQIYKLHNIYLKRKDKSNKYYMSNAYEFKIIERFDDTIDKQLQSIISEFNGIVLRNHIHLNWKYVDQPHVNYIRYVVKKGGKILGYLIIRKGGPLESNVGIISDMLIPLDEEVIGNTLSFAVNLLKSEDVDEIQIATSLDKYQKVLEKLGFVKYGKTNPQCFSNNVDKDNILTDNWFFSKSDHDWDQYPNARYSFYY